jgi:hypothetical protein
MNRDRYDWIAPQAREQIHAQINAVWLAAKHPHVTQDSKQRVVENLRTISNQVYVNERKHRIQFYWLPRIWEWLQARKTFPQGSMQHQQATSDLSAVRDLLYPQEAAYIQQTIQARRQAEAQSLNPT